MSGFNDEMAALPGILADALEYVPAVLSRTTLVSTPEDRDAGRKGVETVKTITGRGKLGTRKVRLADGTERVETVARLIAPEAPEIGDTLTIGVISLTVRAVESTNTIGRPLATKFKVTLS